MIRAYLFDLDGTLLDTEVLWVSAMRAYLADQGLALTLDEATALVYGHSWHDIYAALAAREPRLALGEAHVGAALHPYFERLRASTDLEIPGSVELLKRLAAICPVAVVSGSPRADVAEGLARMGLAGCVQFHLGSEDYGPGKPDPACFLMAARRLKLPPETCLVFEDSAAGVRAARAAGMACVALARPGAPMQDVSAADWVLDDLGKFDPDTFLRRVQTTATSGPRAP